MIKKFFEIEHIPAVLWGEDSDKVFIAVHGNMSNKEDTVIKIFAEKAIKKGYQVISFDLPQHGERNDGILCKVQNCVKELDLIMDYAKQKWRSISLFACSMGAYFSLLAYRDCDIKQSLFLSPVVNMKRIIENMMMWFDVDEARLEKEQEISTPIGQTLYWDYYCDVKEHPIDKGDSRTGILYGSKDDMCESEFVFEFAKKFECELSVFEDGEHYFHTKEQLEVFENWVDKNIL